jgi:hypothetical protein
LLCSYFEFMFALIFWQSIYEKFMVGVWPQVQYWIISSITGPDVIVIKSIITEWLLSKNIFIHSSMDV